MLIYPPNATHVRNQGKSSVEMRSEIVLDPKNVIPLVILPPKGNDIVDDQCRGR